MATTAVPTISTAPDWAAQRNSAWDAWMQAVEASRLQRTGTYANYGLSESNQPKFADQVAAIESGKPIADNPDVKWNADPSGGIQQMFGSQGHTLQSLRDSLASRGIHGGLANQIEGQAHDAQSQQTLAFGKQMLDNLLKPQQNLTAGYAKYNNATQNIDSAKSSWDAYYNYLHPPAPAKPGKKPPGIPGRPKPPGLHSGRPNKPGKPVRPGRGGWNPHPILGNNLTAHNMPGELGSFRH